MRQTPFGEIAEQKICGGPAEKQTCSRYQILQTFTRTLIKEAQIWCYSMGQVPLRKMSNTVLLVNRTVLLIVQRHIWQGKTNCGINVKKSKNWGSNGKTNIKNGLQMFRQISFSSDQSGGAKLQLLLRLFKIYIKNESISICLSCFRVC